MKNAFFRGAALLLALLCLLGAMGCGGGKTAGAKIDLGTSELYTRDELEAAVKLIEKEFSGWKGCELHTLRYAGDEWQTAENAAWLSELAEAQGRPGPITECAMFLSDFHSPKGPKQIGAWNMDEEYRNWQWWLGRPEGGEWQLLTWGY